MNKILILLAVNSLLNFIVNLKIVNKKLSYFNLIFTAFAVVLIGTNLESNNSLDLEVIDENMSYLYPIIMSAFIVSIFLIIKYLKKYKDIIIRIIFFSSIVINLSNIIPIENILIYIITFIWFTFDYLTKGKHNNFKLFVSNLIAILISISSINLIQLKNIKTGVILLIGLFLFDIFWVFGSKYFFKESVMEKVAVNIDMPLLLKYFYSEERPIMFGLGDIIIPGLFLKLLINTDKFYPCIIAYIISLISAITANTLTKLPQPALLYIVPGILGTFYLKN
jgi:hypothetical protein